MPTGDPNLVDLLHRRKDQLIVIDFLDYLPLSFVASTIKSIDIAFTNAGEELLDSLNRLAIKSGKMIVATLGAKGSMAFYEGLSYFQEALKVENIIDTTGCGDAFQAAFVIEWYKSRYMKKSLNQGAFAARQVLGFMGGVE